MNQKFKKLTAISLAALLGLTAAPASAFAQGYTEIEKAALTDAITEYAVQYAQELQEYEALQSGIHEDITLTLDDAGRSLLGFLVPTDISWFKDVRISSDISLQKEGSQFMTAGVYMNDTKLCTIEYFFDMENMNIYMKIPELRDGYIKVNYEEAMKQQQVMLEEQQEAMEGDGQIDPSAEIAMEVMEDSMFTDPDFLKGYMSTLTNLPEYLPDSASLEELLNRYTAVLFDHITDTEPAADTLDFAGTSVDCTVYEGRISQPEAQALLKDVIETAKTDEQIMEFLNKLDTETESEEGIHQSFVNLLNEAAESLNEELEDDGSYISATVAVDENGEALGRSLTLYDVDETIPLYDWQKYINDGHVVSTLQIGPEDEGLGLTGQGTIENGILSGNYTLSVENTDTLLIEVENYDTNAAKENEFYGTYRFTASDALFEGEENSAGNPLQNFALLLDIASDKDSGKFNLSLESAGTSLASLSVEATLGATVEKPDFANLTDVYDSMDDAAMEEYMSGVTFDTILNNVTDAGMPQELLEQLLTGDAGSDEN